MLKKLLKYDLKNILKFLSIFYSIALFFSILTRIFSHIENSFIMSIIAKICSGVTISMIVNIIINSLIRNWVRFKNNFYGDEAYLTHTLPIPKKTLYLSKFITLIISLFTSVLVITITLFIAYYSKNNLEILKSSLTAFASAYNSSIIKIILAFMFIFFLEILNTANIGYTGIILGHKMASNKTGFSVLYGFIAYMILQTIVVLLTFIVALFNKDLMNLFITNEIINIDIVKFTIYLAFIIYIITIILTYILNIKLFKKGVNID